MEGSTVALVGAVACALVVAFALGVALGAILVRKKEKTSRTPTDESSVRAAIRRGQGVTCNCGVWLEHLTIETYERHLGSLKHSRNMDALLGDANIVVCEEVREYRAFARGTIQPTDRVLEIGCHNGGTTKVIWSRKPDALVAIDQKQDLVDIAKEVMPDVTFAVVDAFDTYALRKLAPEGGFTHIFVDISGNRELRSVVQLIDQIEAGLKPKHIIVKSQKLRRLLFRSRLWREMVAERGGLDARTASESG
eukprot:GEMP01026840.1.p1 GENE.GEMP01026840.1~~GEMP01026840.1.p1  ORF type:complete len:251 (+),score=50.69 GEMP01026840.1:36-788(+)